MNDDGYIAAYISLGSNLGEPETNLRAAVAALALLPGVRPGKCSPVYSTEPQGLKDQPWFANQVMRLHCPAGQDPAALLRDLLAVMCQTLLPPAAYCRIAFVLPTPGLP